MKFEIIPDQQTPAVPQIKSVHEYIEDHIISFCEFLAFARTQSNACGLAANQTNADGERFMHRMFALMDLKTREWRLIVDPVIVKYIGISENKIEGCLTWLGKKMVAERARAVEVSYYDFSGTKIKGEIYKGFEAQIWQHEINHLNGIKEQIEDRNFQLPIVLSIRRNESCPCGSKKKYKNCCLKFI